MSLRASELPSLRGELLEYYGSCFRNEHKGFDDIDQASPSAMHGSLRDAELYYISEPMCQLAYQASTTLEAFDLSPWDLDAPHSLMWFEEPIGSKGFPSLISVSSYGGGITIGVFWPRELVREWSDSTVSGSLRDGQAPMVDELEEGVWYPAYLRMIGKRVAFGEPFKSDEEPWTELLARLASCLLLMKQTLTVQQSAYPQRSALRRLERQNSPTSPVRVITLRHKRAEGHGDTVSDREYYHQWVVRGHWRNQACGPNSTLRRPIWIVPHIKGPEGAPLLGGEKVYALKR